MKQGKYEVIKGDATAPNVEPGHVAIIAHVCNDIGACLVFLGILSCLISGCGEDEPSSNWNSNDSSRSEKKESVLHYAVWGYSFEESLPTSFDTDKRPNGVFLVLKLYIHNYGSVPVNVPSIYLRDDKGRTHESTWVGLRCSYSEELLLESLNPDVSTSGYMVFDVPSQYLHYTLYATDGQGTPTYIRIN